MNAATVRQIAVVSLVALFAVVADTALRADTGAADGSMTLSDFLRETATAPVVHAAQLERVRAVAQAEAAGYRGDISVSLSPSVRALWPADRDAADAGSSARGEISASAETAIPLALSADERLRVEQALDAVRVADARIAGAQLEAVSSTLAAYAEAWERQTEVAVLAAELEAIRKSLDAEEARLAAGQISLLEIMRVRRDLENAERSYSRGRADAELAYLDLLMETGSSELPDGAVHLHSPLGEIVEIDLRPPAEVIGTLDHTHPAIASAHAAYEAALREADPARDPLLSSVRLALSTASGHDAAVSASIPSPALRLSYRPPPVTLPGDSGGGGQPGDNSVTLSATFALGIGASRTLAADTAKAEVDRRAAQLAAAYRSVESSILAGYRYIEAAEAAVTIAERALERGELSLEATATRERLGSAPPGEIEAAEAALARARFDYDAARVQLLTRKIKYLEAAHLPGALPEPIAAALTVAPLKAPASPAGAAAVLHGGM